MKRSIYVIMLAIVLIAGCSTNSVKKPVPVPDSRTQYVTTPDEGIPDWFLHLPTAEDGIYGTGQSTKNNARLAQMAADQGAKEAIAEYLAVFIESMLKDHLREVGVGDMATVNATTEYVAKFLTQAELKGCSIDERAKVGNTWYTLAFYNDAKAIQLMTETAEAEMQKEEALYNEWLAKKGHEELEKEMKAHFGEYKKANH